MGLRSEGLASYVDRRVGVNGSTDSRIDVGEDISDILVSGKSREMGKGRTCTRRRDWQASLDDDLSMCVFYVWARIQWHVVSSGGAKAKRPRVNRKSAHRRGGGERESERERRVSLSSCCPQAKRSARLLGEAVIDRSVGASVRPAFSSSPSTSTTIVGHQMKEIHKSAYMPGLTDRAGLGFSQADAPNLCFEVGIFRMRNAKGDGVSATGRGAELKRDL